MIHASLTMRSVSLDMDTRVDVLLPEDRHETKDQRGKKYPVLYVLHGSKDDSSSWINLSNIFLLCRDLDLILVFPSVTNSCYVNMKYGSDYYTWVSEELPVKLKNLFPISDDPKDTFIMGESMGGYGTLRIALSKPHNYAKAVCLSGCDLADFMDFNEKYRIGCFGSKEEYLNSDDNLYKLIEKAKDENDLPDLAFYCGTQDFIYNGCKKIAEECEKKLKTEVVQEYWNGMHNFFFWNEAAEKALKFFGFNVRENDVI